MDHKEQYRYAVMSAQPQPYTGDFPVQIHYHFKLTGNQLDIDNHIYMVKLCADALVQCRVFPGDEQKYIGAITITAEKVPKGGGDEVVVEISPV
jgi:urease beta subunit